MGQFPHKTPGAATFSRSSFELLALLAEDCDSVVALCRQILQGDREWGRRPAADLEERLALVLAAVELLERDSLVAMPAILERRRGHLRERAMQLGEASNGSKASSIGSSRATDGS